MKPSDSTALERILHSGSTITIRREVLHVSNGAFTKDHIRIDVPGEAKELQATSETGHTHMTPGTFDHCEAASRLHAMLWSAADEIDRRLAQRAGATT